MFLIDTNILVYAMSGRYPKIEARLSEIPPDLVKVSAITCMELEYGAAKSRWGERTREKMRQFLAAFEKIPFTDMEAEVCAELRAELESEGQPIGAYDLLIAAQAKVWGLTLITHNLGEFQRVLGLKLEDWMSDEF